MTGRKQLNLLQTILTGKRLAGMVAVSFTASLLYLCCCGVSCADAPTAPVETAAHSGCCSPAPAPQEAPENGCCGDDCDCTLKTEQDSYVLTDGFFPVPTPMLHAVEPIPYAAPDLCPFRKVPTLGTSDLSRAPPLYLRFQILLI